MTTTYRVDYPARNGPQVTVHDSDHDDAGAAEERAGELRDGGYQAVAYRVRIHEQGSAA